MKKLIVTLRQHTPLIHFQYDQDGATLRASEVKPRLDRFLLTQLGKGDYNIGFEQARSNQWLVGNTDHPALDYKMKIIPLEDVEKLDINCPRKERNGNYKMRYSRSHNKEIIALDSYPSYFANMDADYENPFEYKRFSMTGRLRLILSIKDSSQAMLELLDYIGRNFHLANFFMSNNFGTRSSKGFGSFYIDENDSLYIPYDNLCKYMFSVNTNSEMLRNLSRGNKYEKLFKVIEVFYKTLRSGINEKNREGITLFYFKSLAFLYCTNKLGRKWEKRKIEEEFYGIRPIVANDSYDIKDVLGFSTEEQWREQHDSIKKSIAVQAGGGWVKAASNNTAVATRMQSPLMFKPIYNEKKNVYDICLIFREKEVWLNRFLDSKKVYIESQNRHLNTVIDLPIKFSLDEYFTYILDSANFDIDKYVDSGFHSHIYYELLEDIFNQLKDGQV